MERSGGNTAAPDGDGCVLQDTSAEDDKEVAPHLSRVASETVHALRHAILRTGRSWANVPYPSDDDPLSAHFAVVSGNSALLAVGTVLPEVPDWYDGDLVSWRVRGMAARSDVRGSGFGGQVLEALLDHVALEGGGMVWLSGRVRALPFYERRGFVPHDNLHRVAGLGFHQTMWRTIP